MHLLQVTLTAAATPLIPKAVTPANSATFSIFNVQNNAIHNCRIGDTSVSATRGLLLLANGGTFTATPALQFTGDLTEFYLFGTAGDVIDIMIFD